MASPEANLSVLLTRASATHPDNTAIRLDQRSLTYAELDAAVGRAAGRLRARGVAAGDRVALMLPNVPEFAVLYYAILRIGAIVVPLNPLLKEREIEYHLADSEASLLLASPDADDDASADLSRAEAIREPVPREPSDTAVILYTSGTTGRAKGAELTHANLLQNAEITARTLLRCTDRDVLFGGLPLFHSFGQTCGLNAAVASGACLTLLPRFDPRRVLEIVERDRVTVFLGVPTMYAALLALAAEDASWATSSAPAWDTSSLRLCISGGAAMPIEVMYGFEEAFDARILEGYGLSETSPVACFNHPDRQRVPGTIGMPIEGVEMRVLGSDGAAAPDGAPGEIAIRGHNVMKGYWRRPAATAEAIRDGWFRTGDIGVRDAAGRFRIVDRKKDMIIRGGFNVYPREIEEVLYEHPDVAEAAVLGVPDPALGEEVAACVALKQGAATSADELREYVKSRVAPYKYPRRVWVVDALPKGPTGKILKREIAVASLEEA